MRAIEIEFPGIGTYSREWLDQHGEEAQVILSRCKGQYPRCLCRSPGSLLYIAQRSRFYLARLPHSGPDHAPACPSYEPEPSLCGWGIYSSKALEDRGDGRIHLKLAASLAIRGSVETNASPMPLHAAAEVTQRDAVQLRGLLHLLWERAEFNRWRPAMHGRRRYRQIFKYIHEAAEAITLRRHNLTHHLFMPEPFQRSERLQIEARRQRALKERSESASGSPMRVLVAGQLRTVVHMADGAQGLSLAHLPREFLIRAPAQLLSRVRMESEFAWVDWPALHAEFHLIVLLTMQRMRSGHWSADALAAMVTTPEYIPVFSMEEALLAQRLTDEARAFYKPLPYDAVPWRLPNFLLVDCGDSPIPLEILGYSDAENAVRQGRIAQYRELGSPHWLWDCKEASTAPDLTSGADHSARGPSMRETAAAAAAVIVP
ncbi:MAG: DUF1173 family protein [Steroidobacteraceae bacterium]